jgi:hypothetical protein
MPTLHGNLRGMLAAGSYVVVGNIVVLAADTLTILPGTRLSFGPNIGLTVHGLLIASGTPDSLIRFSRQDSSSYNRYWNGIQFVSSHPSCRLDYCVVEYARTSALVCRQSSPVISHCTFRQNVWTASLGTFACFENSSPLIEYTDFFRNSYWAASWGGAVYSELSSPTFNHCRIDSNFATHGGGVYATTSQLTFQNCHFGNNSASDEGAGCDFYDCTVIMRETVLERNYVYADVGTCPGGGIRADGSNITLQDCQIQYNSSRGSVGCEFNACEASIVSSSISHNECYGSGSGGLAAQRSTISLRNCEISDNSTTGDGGGCYFSTSTVSLDSVVLDHNIAARGSTLGKGGAIRTDRSDVTIRHSRISNNKAFGGAGCQFGNSNVIMLGCTVEYDTARATWSLGPGGGIAVVSDSLHAFYMDSCIVRNNKSFYDGGGIHIAGSSQAMLRRCQITDNMAVHAGGGAYLLRPTTANNNIVERCVFFGNSPSGLGGDVHNLTLNSSSFAFNWGGPGINLNPTIRTAIRIRNCDFWRNTGGAIRDLTRLPVGLSLRTAFNVNGDSCDVYQNIFVDPLFVDTLARDFHLMPWSPCIDAGDSSLPQDPDGSWADIGPYRRTRGYGPMPFDLVSPPDSVVWPSDTVRFSWQAAMPEDPEANLTYALTLVTSGEDSTIADPPDTVIQIADTAAVVDIGAFCPDSARIIWHVMAHRSNPDSSSHSRTNRTLWFHPQRLHDFRLIVPADMDTLRTDSVRFCWTDCTWPRWPAPVSYRVRLSADGLDSIFAAQPDTCLHVSLRSLAREGGVLIHWQVLAYWTNPDSAIHSLDQWNFYYDPPLAVPQAGTLPPLVFALHEAYPNPFNAATTIRFDLPKSAAVKLELFDILGRQAGVLVDDHRDPGSYAVVLNGARLPSGLYICRMQTAGFSQTRKILLLK